MKNLSIIITGVTGNLGKAVAEKFLTEGHKVIGTVHSIQKNDTNITNHYCPTKIIKG